MPPPIFRIEFRPEARKALRTMPRNVRELILSKIEALANDPFEAPNVRKLEGRNGWRLRVGAWRILYTVDAPVLTILVVTIATRGDVYR